MSGLLPTDAMLKGRYADGFEGLEGKSKSRGQHLKVTLSHDLL